VVARRLALPAGSLLRLRAPCAGRVQENATLTPAAARWEESLGGEFVLDWDDVVSSPHPYEVALGFARSVVLHACTVCGWDAGLSASVEGNPPPVV
jgi:Family of unknown function (DUF5996)